MSLELETLIALPERVETSDWAVVSIGQANLSGQAVDASTGAAVFSAAKGATVASQQVNLAGVQIFQS